jgi:site-specific DNA recombinase
VAHPNPEKARQGIELTNLVVHPETAKVVEQIFSWRVEGIGFRTIAARLTEQGVPCPSAADRERNPHRHGRTWSVSAVRAIVINPKYKGQGTYGRYRKVERLYDVNDPAAGNVTRMTPAPTAEVIETDGIVAAIVSESHWHRAQPNRSPVTPGPRPDRSQATRYALRGLLICAQCGRRMQGHTVKRRSSARRLGYQCTYRGDYPGDENHPQSLFVAEDRILPAVDGWLSELTSPERIDVTVAAILQTDSHRAAEDPELRRAVRQAAAARKKIGQYLEALEAGMDPKLVTERTRVAQVELATTQAVIDMYESSGRSLLSGDEVHRLLEGVGGLTTLLAEADTNERQRVYRAAGIHLRYQRSAEGEKITASLRIPDESPAWGLSRVGGPKDAKPDWRLQPWGQGE